MVYQATTEEGIRSGVCVRGESTKSTDSPGLRATRTHRPTLKIHMLLTKQTLSQLKPLIPNSLNRKTKKYHLISSILINKADNQMDI